MFTGIIECTGTVIDITTEGTNKTFIVKSSLSDSFHIDQSIAHDGVCLTVMAVHNGCHHVTAIKETLDRTNLGQWNINHLVNIERCVKADSFLDGHIVQGHVDTTAICILVEDLNGSYVYTFQLHNPQPQLMIDKGSVAVNGVSLTVVEPGDNTFKVAIIPYTWSNTGFQYILQGSLVNIEYDVIGKYVARIMRYKV